MSIDLDSGYIYNEFSGEEFTNKSHRIKLLSARRNSSPFSFMLLQSSLAFDSLAACGSSDVQALCAALRDGTFLTRIFETYHSNSFYDVDML